MNKNNRPMLEALTGLNHAERQILTKSKPKL